MAHFHKKLIHKADTSKTTLDTSLQILKTDDNQIVIDISALDNVLGDLHQECWWSFKDPELGAKKYSNIIVNKDHASFISGKCPDHKIPPKAELKKKLIARRKQDVFNHFADVEWIKKQEQDKAAYVEDNKDKIEEQCKPFCKKVEEETEI